MLLHLGGLPRKNEQCEEMISHSGVFRPTRFLLLASLRIRMQDVEIESGRKNSDATRQALPLTSPYHPAFLTSKETSARAK